MTTHTIPTPFDSRPHLLAYLAAGILLAGTLTGCGNLTAGGASEVEVVAASDEGAVFSTADSEAGAASMAPQVDPITGDLSLTLEVVLVDEEGGSVQLTPGFEDVEMDLAAGTRADVAVAEISPGEYETAVVRFTRVEANNVSLPGSASFPSQIVVDLSDGTLEVERPVSLSLGDDDRVRLVVDLRSGIWIVAADPSNGRVARGALRNVVRVEVEGGS